MLAVVCDERRGAQRGCLRRQSSTTPGRSHLAHEPCQSGSPEEGDCWGREDPRHPLPPRQLLDGVGRDEHQGPHPVWMGAGECLSRRPAMGVPEHMHRVDTESVKGRPQVRGDRLGIVRAGEVPPAAMAAEVGHDEAARLAQQWREETEPISRREQTMQEQEGRSCPSVAHKQDGGVSQWNVVADDRALRCGTTLRVGWNAAAGSRQREEAPLRLGRVSAITARSMPGVAGKGRQQASHDPGGACNRSDTRQTKATKGRPGIGFKGFLFLREICPSVWRGR